MFTHLTEPLQWEWLAELSRILKPGGHLILTTQGAAYAEEYLPARAQERFAAGQLVVLNPALAGENECEVYHPHACAKEMLARHFELRDYHPGTTRDRSRGTIAQDVYLAIKPSSS